MRLWQNADGTRRNKYLVQRRDGSVPDWPWFVLAATDPAAPAALRAYADAAEHAGMDPAYVADVRAMADGWDRYRAQAGVGDPDAPPHRTDDPAVVAALGEED